MKTKKAKPYYGLILEIRKQGFSHKDMAEMLGITAQSFSQKINRKSGKDFWFHEAIFISKESRIFGPAINKLNYLYGKIYQKLGLMQS